MRNLKTHFLEHWPKYKLTGVSAIVIFSLVWTVLDWSRFDGLKDRAVQSVPLALGLGVTELLFVAGALLMALTAGNELFEGWTKHSAWKKVGLARKNYKALAHSLAVSPLFSAGFWLNFAGAVGTSLILILAVFKFVPVAGWGLLILLIIDLAATFGWRLPLHKRRMQLRNHRK
jgi:hypothetical protein